MGGQRIYWDITLTQIAGSPVYAYVETIFVVVMFGSAECLSCSLPRQIELVYPKPVLTFSGPIGIQSSSTCLS